MDRVWYYRWVWKGKNESMDPRVREDDSGVVGGMNKIFFKNFMSDLAEAFDSALPCSGGRDL